MEWLYYNHSIPVSYSCTIEKNETKSSVRLTFNMTLFLYAIFALFF